MLIAIVWLKVQLCWCLGWEWQSASPEHELTWKKQTKFTLHSHPHQTDCWQKPGLLSETECRFPNSLDNLFPKQMRNKYLKGTSFMFLVQSVFAIQLGFPWNSCTNGPRNSWNQRTGSGHNWNHFHSYFPSCPDSLQNRLCLCHLQKRNDCPTWSTCRTDRLTFCLCREIGGGGGEAWGDRKLEEWVEMRRASLQRVSWGTAPLLPGQQMDHCLPDPGSRGKLAMPAH